MQYPICIKHGDDEALFGILIPDIPCEAKGKTFKQAHLAAVKAAHAQLEKLTELDQPLPVPSSIESFKNSPDYSDMGWGFIDIDVTLYLGKTEKINATLPSSLISKIDAFVKTHNVKSRSSFLANAAYDKLQGLSRQTRPDEWARYLPPRLAKKTHPDANLITTSQTELENELTEIECEAYEILMEKLGANGWGYGMSETLDCGAFIGPNDEFDLIISMRTSANQLQWTLTWPSTVGKEKVPYQLKAHTLMWGYDLGETDIETEQNFLQAALESIEEITALPRF